MSSPPKGLQPKPAGAPPPRPSGEPPPRPSGEPPPRPSGAPPRPVGAPPPRPAGAPPPRPDNAPLRPVGAPPKPANPPPRPDNPPPKLANAPPRPDGAPPKPENAPPKPVGAPPNLDIAPPKPVGAPPKPAGAPPSVGEMSMTGLGQSRDVKGNNSEVQKVEEKKPSLSPPKPSEPPPVEVSESKVMSTSGSNSPPKVVNRAPPPGAPPAANVIASQPEDQKATSVIGPPPGAPPASTSPIKPPPGAPPASNSPIKPPPGAPPVKPPPGAPPVKPPPGAPPVKPPPGAPSPPKEASSSIPGAPPGPPPGPPPGAPPGPPPGAPPGPPQGVPPGLPLAASPELTAEATTTDAAKSRIEHLLKKGRMRFTLLEARGLSRVNAKSEAKFKADVYCKLKVGAHSKGLKELKSKVWKKSGRDVAFQQELLQANFDQPQNLVADNDLMLTVELWDENMISDELLGCANVSLLRFLHGETFKETIPLLHLKTSLPAGEIDIEFTMLIATPGLLSIILMEGRKLKNMELIGKQDPYCKFEHNGLTKKSKTIEKGGTNPYFGEEEICFWITADSWLHDLSLKCYDEDVGSDDFIGEGSLCVLDPMHVLGVQDNVIALTNGGKPAGEILCKIQFFPAGRLSLKCIAGRKLRDVDSIGQQDPYVKLTLEGVCIKTIVRTEIDMDGGVEPEWDQLFEFDVVDQFNMIVECWDHDGLGEDDLIGEAHLSLLPIFRN
ncbi:calmodulin, partial [Thraustotheca clavata]